MNRLVSLLALVLTLILAACSQVSAPEASLRTLATITVGGSCSLQDAIAAAENDASVGDCAAGSGADIIVLEANTPYTLSGQELVVTTDITIEGNGATIDANKQSRVFDNSGTLTLEQVTVTGGMAPRFENGGGILNSGSLTLNNSAVRENMSNDYGGGIYNTGTLAITDSTVSDNSSFVYGGGFTNIGGTVTLLRSTVSGNSAFLSGGGIGNYDNSTLTVVNSTVSGNQVTGPGSTGGGIRNTGILTLTNATVVDNASLAGGGGVHISSNSVDPALITLNNTVIAYNTGADCLVEGGGSVDAGNSHHNLIEDSSSLYACLLDDGVNGNKLGVDPLLGALADNGGPTLTHLPLEGSPLIDAGSCETATDQRGIARPQGAACEIGAVEVVSQGDTTPPTITPSISGTLGDNSWYTSDVEVSWTVTDSESSVSSSSGCETVTITTDTAGTTLTCTTESEGGESSESVTIKRDATAPVVSVTGVADGAIYVEGKVPTPGCDTSDALSGVATAASLSLSGGPLGSVTATCDGALDVAGNANSASASVTYTVLSQTEADVLIKAVSDLTEHVKNLNIPKNTAKSFISLLENAQKSFEKGDIAGAMDKLMSFINQVEALRGKKINATVANTLIAEAQAILDALD